MSPSVKVMIVDDSATVRQVLSSLLDAEPDIEVIGTAADPLFALEKMNRNWPDVIVLDVEMPRMDGITFMKKLMAERPTPVVICSSLTESGAQTTVQALAAGAMDIITKPHVGLRDFLTGAGKEVAAAVRAAAKANLKRLPPMVAAPPKHSADVVLAAPVQAMHQTTEKVVALGTSTGGTQALEMLLTSLPRTAPGLVVVQHMPEKFTAAFAQRLTNLCEIEVREARQGDRVLPGRALIAPGGRHLLLQRNGAQYQVDVVDGPPVSRHRPSVNVLFRSAARSAGRNAMGIIMTGMGDDGACGLKEMHDAGAWTVAQDEATCVVYGMPREAVKLGGVDRSLPLQELAGAILAFANGPRSRPGEPSV
ncbi:protein-glutamate methylesterase/protein-glutamine glutaminase [Thiocystis violascens]|uniref:Protein-glutamate methylesterase/protein-glutamine glutaminase n=1 Tax=Thiocystis violascens (strain ATCC 17096 / DSM 198 / 6111) TaxID=765911 RepID=I3YG24_THIV6|nr:chemotaxis response regulator protein-glutamate methylesterase [Thiocystis violascens]AFL75942.1 chemotaxis response regulator containing a CheY-like receiver domain and a methylesterase domain [Thiocystis violascens DSM 198]